LRSLRFDQVVSGAKLVRSGLEDYRPKEHKPVSQSPTPRASPWPVILYQQRRRSYFNPKHAARPGLLAAYISSRSEIHSTSPNFRSSLASPKSPVAGIPAAAERGGADEAGFARQGLRLHHRGIRVEALDGFAGCDAGVGRDERQSDVVGHFRGTRSRPQSGLATPNQSFSLIPIGASRAVEVLCPLQVFWPFWLALESSHRTSISHPYTILLDGNGIAFMTNNVRELRPRIPDTEKITINLGYVDLGQVDLMVQEGFYSNRTDFIRTAIRNQLERHADVVKQSTARNSLDLGLRNFSREDLEATRRAGEMLHINVLGLATIAHDVTPDLARATIASISVLGALHATPAVKAALADRTR
jgi:Arc/MetJ-type ribon-helix-helix transcriptional regulator